MALKSILAVNEPSIGIVFSLVTKVHRRPHCCSRKSADYLQLAEETDNIVHAVAKYKR